MINEGDTAPSLTVTTTDAGSLDIGAPGQPLVLYFYPKDDTSGCTREAQDFTALAGDYAKAGVRVVGVSRDPMKSHDKFIGKYGLKVPLVSDEDGRISEAFGTWVEKSMYGRKYMGMERATYLIGADGRVLKVWRKVKVPNHAAEVLKAARELAAARLFPGELLQHQLPVDDIVVQRLHREPLVLAVGAVVCRDFDPGAVDGVNRDTDHAKWSSVGRARRHFGKDRHSWVQRLHRVGEGRDDVRAKRGCYRRDIGIVASHDDGGVGDDPLELRLHVVGVLTGKDAAVDHRRCKLRQGIIGMAGEQPRRHATGPSQPDLRLAGFDNVRGVAIVGIG